jgi:hypothetical protein
LSLGVERLIVEEREEERKESGVDLTIILRTRARLGNFGVGEFPFGAILGRARK